MMIFSTALRVASLDPGFTRHDCAGLMSHKLVTSSDKVLECDNKCSSRQFRGAPISRRWHVSFRNRKPCEDLESIYSAMFVFSVF